MVQHYSINELVDCAIEIESQGRRFYTAAAKVARNKFVQDLFIFLATQEELHEQLYREMLRVIDAARNPGTLYSEEYHRYIGAFVDGVIFGGALPEAADDLAAIDFAIAREKDSVLFYSEMRNFVGVAHHDIVEKIIAEERDHVLRLLEVKEGIS